jgi:hypothetical protein
VINIFYRIGNKPNVRSSQSAAAEVLKELYVFVVLIAFCYSIVLYIFLFQFSFTNIETLFEIKKFILIYFLD